MRPQKLTLISLCLLVLCSCDTSPGPKLIIPTAIATPYSTHTPTITQLPTGTSTSPPTPTATSGIGSKTQSTKDNMIQVYVPAGTFLMGSRDSEISAYDNEKPQHEVYLESFWLDETEITNSMYEGCVQAGACEPPSSNASHKQASYYGNPEYGNYPVVFVTWFQANTYCEWTGRRLPSETEWEKAARGIDGRLYPWGNQNVTGELANFADRNTDADWADPLTDDGYQDTAPVGSYPDGASPYGALDMAGNVWEWVYDHYDAAYYLIPSGSNPGGPETGEARVIRGGSWYFHPRDIRAAFRYGHAPAYVSCSGGFRCANSTTPGN
jgi:formylglycine-generating enzyme required for sulfatase activity